MKNTLTVLAGLIAFFLFVEAADAAEEELELTCETMEEIYSLWSDSWFGQDPMSEKSAWVIRTAERSFQWIRWPSSRKWKKERWKGDVPPNLVAQVHTHPISTDPKPSFKDHVFSNKVNAPLYTVSRKGIWRVSPGGKVIKIAGSNWHMNLYKFNCSTKAPVLLTGSDFPGVFQVPLH
jgi:hypothetical protein